MIRVYVAGAYSASNTIDTLKNIGRGEEVAAELFNQGFAPFTPWHDKDFIIKNPYHEYTVKQFQDYSLEWLKVCHCVYLVPGWESSKGTEEEIRIARQMPIPVFKKYEEILEYKRDRALIDFGTQAKEEHAALKTLHAKTNEAPYGFCPKCGRKGVTRERRLNGNDTCADGHIYPSKEAVDLFR